MGKQKKLLEFWGYLPYVMMYGGTYFAYAMGSVLISVYLMDRGFRAVEVSFLISMSFVISMVLQPVAGFLQDRYNPKNVSLVMLGLSAGTALLFIVQRNYMVLVVLYGLTIALSNGANPYMEKLATMSPYSYRSIRLLGTVGFAVGSQAAGVVYERISGESMFLFFAGAILLAVLGGLRVQEGRGEPGSSAGRLRAQAGRRDKLEAQAERGGKLEAQAGRRDRLEAQAERGPGKNYRKEVLGNGMFLFYLLLASLFYAVTNLNNTYLPALFQLEGVSVTVTSAVLFLATLAEMPMIFFAARYMDKFSNSRLLGILFLLLAVQFGIYSLLPLPPVHAAITVLLRSTVTMTFAMLNIKVVAAIIAPAYQMSALTLVSAISRNLITILMQNVGGAILDGFSMTTLYGVLAVVAAAGLILTIAFRLPDIVPGEDGAPAGRGKGMFS